MNAFEIPKKKNAMDEGKGEVEKMANVTSIKKHLLKGFITSIASSSFCNFMTNGKIDFCSNSSSANEEEISSFILTKNVWQFIRESFEGYLEGRRQKKKKKKKKKYSALI
eukprot:Trichotokara_eunicae@DN3728_c0_g1_i1.p1